MRASTRSAVSRSVSTPCRNSSSSVLLTKSRLSSCRYSAMFSPAVRPALRAHSTVFRASCEMRRAGTSPISRDSSSSKSGRAKPRSSRYEFAISASPLTTAPAPRPRPVAPDNRSSARGDPAMIASTGSRASESGDEPAPMSDSRPRTTLMRIDAIPSMSRRIAVPARRPASAVACIDAWTPRLSKASTVAIHAGVAAMSDLVPAVQRDDAAAQIVVPDLGITGGPQHLEQGFLVGMHAYGLRQVAIAGFVARHESPQQRQHVERIGVVQRLEARCDRARKFEYQQLATGLQHPQHRVEGGGLVGHVAQTEADGYAIERIVVERQSLGIRDQAF